MNELHIPNVAQKVHSLPSIKEHLIYKNCGFFACLFVLTFLPLRGRNYFPAHHGYLVIQCPILILGREALFDSLGQVSALVQLALASATCGPRLTPTVGCAEDWFSHKGLDLNQRSQRGQGHITTKHCCHILLAYTVF